MVDVNAAARRDPQTLEDVQVGDEVVLVAWQSYSRHRIGRITPTLIVTDSGIRIRKKDGSSWGARAAIGIEAAAKMVQIDATNRRRAAGYAFCRDVCVAAGVGTIPADLTPATVTAARAACDAAEAALRDLGEWEEDAPQHPDTTPTQQPGAPTHE